ncbi:nuclease-related domain-containing protein [Enterovibrio norvegicus]|uniref:nuclease-related domain-containing protein n=1 Tax=Enterovibrio norvegicus TaxID=188144 RepID=UPI00352C7824
MKKESFEIIRDFKKEKISYLLEKNSEDELIYIFNNAILEHNSMIYKTSIINRDKRDDFIEKLRQQSMMLTHYRLEYFLTEKSNIIKASEKIFDEIKEKLDNLSIIKNESIEEIVELFDREISEITYLAKREVEKKYKNKNIVVGEEIKISIYGQEANPDYVIEQMVQSLGLCLTFLAYKNSWFKKGFPFNNHKKHKTNKIDKQEIIKMVNLATSWRKLDSISSQAMLFNGFIDERYIEDNEAIVYDFNTYQTEFEINEFIASKRLVDKLSQSYFETAIKTKTNFNEVDSQYFEEVNAINELSEVYCDDILSLKIKYLGLNLSEWVVAFSEIKKISSKDRKLIYSYGEIETILQKRGLTHKQIRNFIKTVTFNEKSKDIFDNPIIKTNEGNFFLVKSAAKCISLSQIIISVLSTNEVTIKNKGYNFEDRVIKKTKEYGIKCDSFKFKRGLNEYEYDAVILLDDKIFIFECKNRSLSQGNPIKSARLMKDFEKFSQQVSRLVDGLRKHPEEINKRFNINSHNYEIIPVIMNCLPFSFMGIFNGVYITDFSCYSKFLHGSIDFIENVDNKLKEKSIYRLREKGNITAKDLILNLSRPFQVRVYLESLDLKKDLLYLDEDTYLCFTHCEADKTIGLRELIEST